MPARRQQLGCKRVRVDGGGVRICVRSVSDMFQWPRRGWGETVYVVLILFS